MVGHFGDWWDSHSFPGAVWGPWQGGIFVIHKRGTDEPRKVILGVAAETCHRKLWHATSGQLVLGPRGCMCGGDGGSEGLLVEET